MKRVIDPSKPRYVATGTYSYEGPPQPSFGIVDTHTGKIVEWVWREDQDRRIAELNAQ